MDKYWIDSGGRMIVVLDSSEDIVEYVVNYSGISNTVAGKIVGDRQSFLKFHRPHPYMNSPLWRAMYGE